MKRFGLLCFLLVQLTLAIRVFRRMAQTRQGVRISATGSADVDSGSISVIVPVLDETGRLGPCLDKLCSQGSELREIIVVDGGSTDGTQQLVRERARLDARISLVDASPVPELVNGKAFGLMVGANAASRESRWIATVDADVRLQPGALSALLSHARGQQVRAMSVATSQRIQGKLLGLLHPSMLATLVYRFGIPGNATVKVDRVQANGQCFLIERGLLEEVGGFESVLDSICEDVTLARSVANLRVPVGFYESDGLIEVEMYKDGSDAWRNWTRSLPMKDRYSTRSADVGLAELALIQTAPPILLLAGLRWLGTRNAFTQLQAGLTIARLGVLAGTARAYPTRPWTYWLSPLADLPVTIEIARRSRRRVHTWRGRTIAMGVEK